MDSSGNSKGCMDQFLTYVCTLKGKILTVEIVLCIIILICYGASWTPGYVTLAVTELVLCIVFFIIYMCDFHTQLNFIHWGWSDFLRAAIAFLAFLITSIIVLIGHHDGAGIAAGVFGLLTGVFFGYDAYTSIPLLKKANPSPHTVPTEGI
ncbi:proteolipid protein 2 isoform X2 [Hemicordylus capensis]|uniref:proteolipid protein 2 isoform X2 n=1 Tax=Hemicordylus capensis TaxID=884348 RepID=UPI0023034E21|nr:proteolipid protein 2 isoform X2 [Hemicordylus capensis]